MESQITNPQEGGVGNAGKVKGFFLGLYSKFKSVKTEAENKEKFSLFEQLRGINQFVWLISFIFTVFVLYKYFSPLITKLAMESVIAPVAALSLIIIGEFDYSKLTSMLASNVGIVLKITGVLILGLFLQNIVKSAVFIQSFTKGHEKYRTYALASLLTPITTAALWYGLTHYGYFIATKTISLGMLAMFASGEAAEALKNVKSIDTVSTEDLSNVAKAMSNSLRFGLGALLSIHLYFVFVSYKAIHRLYHLAFDAALTRTVPFLKAVPSRAKSIIAAVFEPIIDRIIPLIVTFIVLAVLMLAFRSMFVSGGGDIAKVSCNNGYTQITTVAGKDWTLKTAEGKGVCFDPDAYKYLAVGPEFHINNVEYRRLIIKDGAISLDRDNEPRKYNNGSYVKENYMFPHDQIFWAPSAATGGDTNTMRYKPAR